MNIYPVRYAFIYCVMCIASFVSRVGFMWLVARIWPKR